MEGMDEDCCPMKKIWGSMDPKMDGVYKNVGTLPRESLPRRCNSPCVYERKGWEDGLQFCFGDSMYSQSQCQDLETIQIWEALEVDLTWNKNIKKSIKKFLS